MTERPAALLHDCPGECGTKVRIPGVPCGPCSVRQARVGKTAADQVFANLEALGINVPARGRFTFDEACQMVGPKGALEAKRFVDAVTNKNRWEPIRGLILEGPTGVGKSLLACAIVRDLIERRALKASEVRYDSSRLVWGAIKQGYGTGNANDELEARIRARLWVLDDLGAEHPSDDTALNLTDILTARELRPTVVTANLPQDVQGQRWDPMIWDRIKSRLGERNFEIVTITGPDHRARSAA